MVYHKILDITHFESRPPPIILNCVIKVSITEPICHLPFESVRFYPKLRSTLPSYKKNKIYITEKYCRSHRRTTRIHYSSTQPEIKLNSWSPQYVLYMMMAHISAVTSISRPPNNAGRVDYKIDRKDEKHIF